MNSVRVVESGADGPDEINNSPTRTTAAAAATAGRLVAAQARLGPADRLLGPADRPGVIAPPRRQKLKSSLAAIKGCR